MQGSTGMESSKKIIENQLTFVSKGPEQGRRPVPRSLVTSYLNILKKLLIDKSTSCIIKIYLPSIHF